MLPNDLTECFLDIALESIQGLSTLAKNKFICRINIWNVSYVIIPMNTLRVWKWFTVEIKTTVSLNQNTSSLGNGR